MRINRSYSSEISSHNTLSANQLLIPSSLPEIFSNLTQTNTSHCIYEDNGLTIELIKKSNDSLYNLSVKTPEKYHFSKFTSCYPNSIICHSSNNYYQFNNLLEHIVYKIANSAITNYKY